MYYTYSDLIQARVRLENDGGWLLQTGDNAYTVTDDQGIVVDMRGRAFVIACEETQVWDETSTGAKP
jgi:hypothetical protein